MSSILDVMSPKKLEKLGVNKESISTLREKGSLAFAFSNIDVDSIDWTDQSILIDAYSSYLKINNPAKHDEFDAMTFISKIETIDIFLVSLTDKHMFDMALINALNNNITSTFIKTKTYDVKTFKLNAKSNDTVEVLRLAENDIHKAIKGVFEILEMLVEAEIISGVDETPDLLDRLIGVDLFRRGRQSPPLREEVSILANFIHCNFNTELANMTDLFASTLISDMHLTAKSGRTLTCYLSALDLTTMLGIDYDCNSFTSPKERMVFELFMYSILIDNDSKSSRDLEDCSSLYRLDKHDTLALAYAYWIAYRTGTLNVLLDAYLPYLFKKSPILGQERESACNFASPLLKTIARNMALEYKDENNESSLEMTRNKTMLRKLSRINNELKPEPEYVFVESKDTDSDLDVFMFVF